MSNPNNPALPLVKEVAEIRVCGLHDLKTMAAMLSTGKWITMAAAVSKDGSTFLFSMGRVC